MRVIVQDENCSTVWSIGGCARVTPTGAGAEDTMKNVKQALSDAIVDVETKPIESAPADEVATSNSSYIDGLVNC
ncbi:hypothetical protein [Carnimonas bestiolae]|uniref:hypothetical protein n=1 Tax=Carnimonas bestiolae TaxID=3402172 RepID=UPI003EDC6E3F